MINKIPSFESQMGQIKEAKRIMEEIVISEAVADNELTKDLCYIVNNEKDGYVFITPGLYINSDEVYEWRINK